MRAISRSVASCFLLIFILAAGRAVAADLYELAFFIEPFLKDAAVNLPKWERYAKEANVTWAPDETDAISGIRKRSGIVFLTAKGKEFYGFGNPKNNVPWEINVTGDGIRGIEAVTFEPSFLAYGKENSGMHIPYPDALLTNPALNLEYICSERGESGGEQTDFYIIRAENKATVMEFYSTWGSGGYSDRITLDYRLPIDKGELVPELGNRCNSKKQLER